MDEWEIGHGEVACYVCGRQANHVCSRCKSAVYCSDRCHHFDWHHDGHSDACHPSPAVSQELIGKRVRGRTKRTRGPSRAKAKKMLRHGSVNGRRLTAKQKRYFGWIAGGRK